MEKAYLYEALYLVNHRIDEAVRGVHRLKESPTLSMKTYHKSMAALERRRSLINLQFMLEMRRLEELDEAYFEWEAEPERANKHATKRRKPNPKAMNSAREKSRD